MLAASLSFLSPRAGALAVLVLLPSGAVLVAERRVGRARRLLGLQPPDRSRAMVRAALLAAFVLLLVVAAMQPVLRSSTAVRARTDAEAIVVLDTSRSMLASPAPGRPTRLAAARAVAFRLAASLPGVPLGVATLTDRVLPDVFATSDQALFDSVVRAVRIDDPPPRDVSTVATTFDALTELATEGYFPPSAHRRSAILVTDGETRAFDPANVAATLRDHGIALSVVQVGTAADRVWKANGSPEANYRPDRAAAGLALQRLRAAAGAGPDAVADVRRALGTGPERQVGVEPRFRPLAPYAAVVALLALAGALGGAPRKWLHRVTFRDRVSRESPA